MPSRPGEAWSTPPRCCRRPIPVAADAALFRGDNARPPRRVPRIAPISPTDSSDTRRSATSAPPIAVPLASTMARAMSCSPVFAASALLLTRQRLSDRHGQVDCRGDDRPRKRARDPVEQIERDERHPQQLPSEIRQGNEGRGDYGTGKGAATDRRRHRHDSRLPNSKTTVPQRQTPASRVRFQCDSADLKGKASPMTSVTTAAPSLHRYHE